MNAEPSEPLQRLFYLHQQMQDAISEMKEILTDDLHHVDIEGMTVSDVMLRISNIKRIVRGECPRESREREAP